MIQSLHLDNLILTKKEKQMKIYSEKKAEAEKKKEISLKLGWFCGEIILMAVNKEGYSIANLLNITTQESPCFAKKNLEENGYDTSGIVWNDKGSMKITN